MFQVPSVIYRDFCWSSEAIEIGEKNFPGSARTLADERHFILGPEPNRAHASLPTLYAAPVVTWILYLLAFAREQ